MRSIKASPYINDEILAKAQELSKNFQLSTPIFIGSVDNAKASDKVLNKNTNMNVSSESLQALSHAGVLIDS